MQAPQQTVLSGKKILVTGGSRGIGASIVRTLAQKGARVFFTYSTQSGAAESVLKELPGEGHGILAMNLNDEASVEAAVQDSIAKMGGLDGLVNNAGITKDTLILRMKSEDFDQVINTNLRGTFLATRTAVKSMIRARTGSIVNITSVIGQMGNAGQSNYAASKAGIEAFSKSIAREVASRSVRVNCIAPGFISTEMTDVLTDEQKANILSRIPLERIAGPEEVAYSVAFLLSDESKYITGQTLSVNGGMWMA